VGTPHGTSTQQPIAGRHPVGLYVKPSRAATGRRRRPGEHANGQLVAAEPRRPCRGERIHRRATAIRQGAAGQPGLASYADQIVAAFSTIGSGIPTTHLDNTHHDPAHRRVETRDVTHMERVIAKGRGRCSEQRWRRQAVRQPDMNPAPPGN
jgi:hypothetical protein